MQHVPCTCHFYFMVNGIKDLYGCWKMCPYHVTGIIFFQTLMKEKTVEWNLLGNVNEITRWSCRHYSFLKEIANFVWLNWKFSVFRFFLHSVHTRAVGREVQQHYVPSLLHDFGCSCYPQSFHIQVSVRTYGIQNIWASFSSVKV